MLGGPVALDALFDGDYGSPDRPEDERALDELRLKLAVALKLLPIDATTAPRLIRLYLRLRQAELAAEGARRVQPVGKPGLRSRQKRGSSGNDRPLTEDGAPISHTGLMSGRPHLPPA